MASDKFTNEHLCGATSGTIVARSGLRVSVESPAGLVVKASGTGEGTATLTACGSLTVKALSGPIQVVAGGLTITISTNTTAMVVKPGSGQRKVTVISGSGRVQVVNGAFAVDLVSGQSVGASTVSAISVPALSTWAILTLAALLVAGFGWRMRRATRRGTRS